MCAKLRMLLVLVCCPLFLTQPNATLADTEASTVRHGHRESPRIAITIDDYYDHDHILPAIELCEKYGVVVTFFSIGNAPKFADGKKWQRALDTGCEIGNHSWGHKNLTMLSARSIRFQMLRTKQKNDEMLGYYYPLQVMRPPFGSTNNQVAEVAAFVGYTHVVKWDVSQTDVKQIIKDVWNGSILLFHVRAKDIRCLEVLIPESLDKGYVCVTISELLGLEVVVVSEEIYIYDAGQAARN